MSLMKHLTLKLHFSAYLRQVIGASEILEDALSKLEGFEIGKPEFLIIPFLPEKQGETYHIINKDGKDYYVVQQVTASREVSSEAEADELVSKFGGEATYAELKITYFMDRGPL